MKKVIILYFFIFFISLNANAQGSFGTSHAAYSFNDLVYHFRLNPKSQNPKVKSLPELRDSIRRYVSYLENKKKDLGDSEFYNKYGYDLPKKMNNYWDELSDFCEKYFQKGKFKLDLLLADKPQKYTFYPTMEFANKIKWLYIVGYFTNNEYYIDYAIRYINETGSSYSIREHKLSIEWLEMPHRDIAKKGYCAYNLLHRLGFNKEYEKVNFYTAQLHFLLANKNILQKNSPKSLYPTLSPDTTNLYTLILEVLSIKFEDYILDVDRKYREGNYLVSLDSFLAMDLVAQTPNAFNSAALLLQENIKNSSKKDLKALDLKRITFFRKYSQEDNKDKKLHWLLRQNIRRFKEPIPFCADYYREEIQFIRHLSETSKAIHNSQNMDKFILPLFEKAWSEKIDSNIVTVYYHLHLYSAHTISSLIYQSIANTEGVTKIAFQLWLANRLESSADSLERATLIYSHLLTQQSTTNQLLPEYLKLLIQPKIYFDPETFEEIYPAYTFPTLYHLIVDYYLGFYKNFNDAKLGRDSSLFLPFQQKYTPNYLQDTITEHQLIKAFQHILNYQIQNAPKDTSDFLAWELKRLETMHQLSWFENRDELYVKGLKELYQYYKGTKYGLQIGLIIVEKLTDFGYPYETAPREYPYKRWLWKDASNFAFELGKVYAKNQNIDQLIYKIQNLNKQRLGLTAESFVLANQPFKILAKNRNIDTIFVEIYKSHISENAEWGTEWDSNSNIFKTFNIPNLNHGDLREHITELPMPALPSGQYQLYFLYKGAYNEENMESISITVSNIMLVPHDKNHLDSISYYIINRHTGAPLVGAKVSAYSYYRDSSFWVIDSFAVSPFTGKDTVTTEKKVVPIYTWQFYGLADNFGKISFPKIEDLVYDNPLKKQDIYDYYYQEKVYHRYYKKMGIRYQEDTLYIDGSVRTNDIIQLENPIVYHGYLFTDRAIYRPGQMVYFKGLVTDGEGQTIKNLARKDYVSYVNVSVGLFNSRGELIDDKYIAANQFGSFSDSIEIPTNGMTGEYTLKIKSIDVENEDTSYTYTLDTFGLKNSTYGRFLPTTFNVEEYKRLTFETTFLPLDKYYSIADLVPVKGLCKAYAGYPISNAKITYKIEREVNFPDRWWFNWEAGDYDDNGNFIPKYQKKKYIDAGTVYSNDLGEFTIPFRGLRHPKHNEFAEYFYTVEATITDALTGETHTAKYEVRLCEQSLNVNLVVPEELFVNEENNLNWTIEDAAQKPVKTAASLRIYKLKTPANPKHLPIWEEPTSFILSEKEHDAIFPNLPYKNEYEISNWEKGEAVLNLAFNPLEQSSYLLKKSSLPEGDYVAELEVFDSLQNKPIFVKKYFKQFDLNKKDCQVSTPIWMFVDKTTVNIGDTLHVHFASAKNEVYALLRIEQNSQILYKKWIKINGKATENILITNRFKGDVHYYLDVAMDNRHYSQDGHIEVLHSPTKVQIEFLSFRDKLLPGQKERWEWTIKDQFGKPLKAELLATLYDASLDVMRRNRFIINSPIKKYYSHQLLFYWESLFELVYSEGAYTYSYDTILTFDPETFEEPTSVVANTEAPEKFKLVKPKPSPNKGNQTEQNLIRTNLKETVFFQPHLQTDKDGKVALEFTMNEALTRWRLMLLAHTNQMEYAMSERTVITQKEIMVQPNTPRFARVGDELFFTAKVVNLSQEKQKGIATLEILDPATMKPIKVFMPKVSSKQKFDLAAQKSAMVRWAIKIPDGYENLVYRVIAKAGKIGDGEQNKFAILPNTMLATTSTPINIKGGQNQNYDLKTLLPINSSQKSEAYGLELTTNPAWDAIRALSYNMEYPHHCSEQLLNRYYANTLAMAVLQSNPKVSETFKKWRAQGLSKSRLLENAELREALLSESPWLASASDESEVRWRLSLLFDLDSMRSRQNIVLDILKTRQNPDGGFSWYGGPQSSPYISQYVLENLGHLKQLTKDQFPIEKTNAMLRSATYYVDKIVKRKYQDWMFYIKAVGADTNRFELDNLNIHYLYARSFMPFDSMSHVVYNFILQQAWRKCQDFIENDYLTGLLCLALHRNGKKTEANILIDSLKSHATIENDLMYWEKTSGYYWYQNHLETQALMIEVFHEVAQDAQALVAMKTWLIQQKTDNYWNSTKATSAAVYALLIGNNWLSDSQVPTITVNNKTVGITEENLAPGTGQLKQRWEKQDIQQISISNNNKEVPMTGSIYHQFYTPLDQIPVATDTNACYLHKTIYKIIYTKNGDSLALVTDKTILNTGDKLRIQLEFYNPQPLEFLHLKDQRPASCEPTEYLSGFRYQNGMGFYLGLRDASTNFFIEYLPKGKHELVYELLVNQKGNFQSGYSMLQSMYAPEYTVYDRSRVVRVE